MAIIPVAAYLYVVLILPLISKGGERAENLIFWPVLAACVVALAVANRSLLITNFVRSLPITSFAVYMAFAAASVGWALAPSYAFSRYVLQLLIAITVILPYAFPIDPSRTVLRLTMCTLAAVLVSAVFILTTPPSLIGHAGYFTHKQELGIFAGAAIILGTHELLSRGWRRLLGAVTICLTFWMMFQSQSKAPLAFVFAAVAFGTCTVIACKLLKTTPTLIVGAVAIGFIALSYVWSDPVQRIAWHLYGDATITGRVYIWDFINAMISQKRWLGWGFHSYWSVPNSPHHYAPGFVKDMLTTHSGYLEVKLDTGRIGYCIFLVFLYASLHFMDPRQHTDLIRCWLFITIATYILLVNLLESVWLSAGPLWVLFLIVVSESIHISQKNSGAGIASARPTRQRLLPRQKIGRAVNPARGVDASAMR